MPSLGVRFGDRVICVQSGVDGFSLRREMVKVADSDLGGVGHQDMDG